MWGESPGQPVAQRAGQLRAGLSPEAVLVLVWVGGGGSKERERRAGGRGSPKRGHGFFKESPEMWVCQPERREWKQPPAEMGTGAHGVRSGDALQACCTRERGPPLQPG